MNTFVKVGVLALVGVVLVVALRHLQKLLSRRRWVGMGDLAHKVGLTRQFRD